MDWFKKNAGGLPTRREGDLTITVHGGETIPQCVRLPPTLGGGVVAVTGVEDRACDYCGGAHTLLRLDAEHSGRPMGVFEVRCLRTFHWVALPAPGEE